MNSDLVIGFYIVGFLCVCCGELFMLEVLVEIYGISFVVICCVFFRLS